MSQTTVIFVIVDLHYGHSVDVNIATCHVYNVHRNLQLVRNSNLTLQIDLKIYNVRLREKLNCQDLEIKTQTIDNYYAVI